MKKGPNMLEPGGGIIDRIGGNDEEISCLVNVKVYSLMRQLNIAASKVKPSRDDNHRTVSTAVSFCSIVA